MTIAAQIEQRIWSVVRKINQAERKVQAHEERLKIIERIWNGKPGRTESTPGELRVPSAWTRETVCEDRGPHRCDRAGDRGAAEKREATSRRRKRNGSPSGVTVEDVGDGVTSKLHWT